MSRLRLTSGVYLVDGYVASCIYDLREEFAKIYWLDAECRGLVRQHMAGVSLAASLPDVIGAIVNLGLASIGDGASSPDLPAVTRGQPIIHAWIEITERCQLRCIYCYGKFGGGGNNARTMTVSEADFVLAWLQSSDIRSVQIIGGEPFVNRDVTRHLVRGLHAQGMSVEIYTNGLRLEKDDADFLSAHGVRLAVSIFGATEAEAAAVTGYANTFREQMRTVKMLEAHEVSVRYSITRTVSNSGSSAKDISAIFGIHGGVAIREDIARPVGRATDENIVGNKLDRMTYINKGYFSRKIKSSTVKNNISGHSCLMRKICISTSMDVYPCTMERSISYGNIRFDTALDIERASVDYRFASKDKIDICSLCEYRYACFDCPPRRPGGFYSKPTICLYDPHASAWREEP